MAETRTTPRERARAEMIEQIKRTARARLADEGPDLSLRAVARELGVVSSAVYRYYASRNDLLTALIIDGYDSMGAAVEAAEAAVPNRTNLDARWGAVCRAVRDWALERPHEYALLYGSPVPGYAAPADTVEPAQRALLVAIGVLRDGVERGAIEIPTDRLPRAVRADLTRVATIDGYAGIPVTVMSRAMSVWAQLFGTVSFELFGRYTGAVTHPDEYFELQVRVMSTYLGLS